MTISFNHLGNLGHLGNQMFQYAAQHSEIIPQFLFMTDGYNFRNTDINAVLGQSQLPRLNKNIGIRNMNYEYFHQILMDHKDKFYIPEAHCRISSFCFPLIAYQKETFTKLKERLVLANIEFRPVVGGNLLKQPFLKDYDAHCPNADILHDRGLYLGNSQFVNFQMINKLSEILESL